MRGHADDLLGDHSLEEPVRVSKFNSISFVIPIIKVGILFELAGLDLGGELTLGLLMFVPLSDLYLIWLCIWSWMLH